MLSDPIKLFEQMFAIVGHTESEQKQLAQDLFSAIMQKTVGTLMLKLSDDKKQEVQSLLSTGKQPNDILYFFLHTLDEKIVEEHVSASSFQTIQTYIKDMGKELTSTQKEQLMTLFSQS